MSEVKDESLLAFLDYKKILYFQAILAGIYGLLFLLLPQEVNDLNGFTSTTELQLITRFVGWALIGIGLFALVMSEVTDSNVLRNLSVAVIISSVIGILIVLFGTFTNLGNLMFLSNILPNGLILLGYGYLLWTKAYEN